MKILFVIANPPYDSIYGGSEVFVKNVAERLVKKGHEVHVLSEKRGKNLKNTEIIDSLHIHRYSFLNIPKIRILTNPRALYKRIKKIAKDYNIDVLCANGVWYDGYVCAKMAMKLKIPSILIIHNISSSYAPNKYIRKKASLAIKKCSRIVAVSKWVKKDVVENFGIGPKNVTVIYHGVKQIYLDSKFSQKEKENIRKLFALKGKYPIITCLSRFKYPQKRQDILIRAGQVIMRSYPNFKMVFMGSGNLSICKKISKELNLGGYIMFLESLPDEEVVKIMGISDLFAFPTEWEGFGIVLIEAMAMGLPVIASKTQPLDEIIKDGFNGKLVNSSPEGFSKEIIKLLDDKKRVSKISKNAKEYAKRFDWDVVVNKFEDVLNQLRMVK